MSTNCKNDMCINIHVKRITSPTGEVRAEISIEPRTGRKIEKAWRKAGTQTNSSLNRWVRLWAFF